LNAEAFHAVLPEPPLNGPRAFALAGIETAKTPRTTLAKLFTPPFCGIADALPIPSVTGTKPPIG
jgi:hypothetical protein